MSEHYKKSGVDIDAGEEAVRRIGRLVASTRTAGTAGAFGGFGGLFDPAAAGVGAGDLLVAGADGVGTKLKLAFATGRHDSVGIDCVAMCVNDVLAVGARPLFFLDYLAVGRLAPDVVEAVVAGVAEGCRQAGCALLGGETAELPGLYAEGEYDLAGFAVGSVARDRVIDGRGVASGQVLIGLPSSGLHSNGYSLVRRVLLDEAGLALDAVVAPLARPLWAELLEPTRIYVGEVWPGLREVGGVGGLVHVTGGGLVDNLPRVLPAELGVRLDSTALADVRLPIFDLVQRLGGIPEAEMVRVFNLGVGFVLVVEPAVVDAWLARLGGAARVVGEVVPRAELPDPAVPVAF